MSYGTIIQNVELPDTEGTFFWTMGNSGNNIAYNVHDLFTSRVLYVFNIVRTDPVRIEPFGPFTNYEMIMVADAIGNKLRLVDSPLNVKGELVLEFGDEKYYTYQVNTTKSHPYNSDYLDNILTWSQFEDEYKVQCHNTIISLKPVNPSHFAIFSDEDKLLWGEVLVRVSEELHKTRYGIVKLELKIAMPVDGTFTDVKYIIYATKI